MVHFAPSVCVGLSVKRSAKNGRAWRSRRGLRASTDVGASPRDTWQTVGGVRRTEWSPSACASFRSGGCGAEAGCWVLNRRGRVRWATLSRVVRFEPEIACSVATNRSVGAYQLEPVGSGTRLTETRQAPDGIGRGASAFTRLHLGGQRHQDDELETGMRQGLERIRAILQVDTHGCLGGWPHGELSDAS